jgi:hypothetical protein
MREVVYVLRMRSLRVREVEDEWCALGYAVGGGDYGNNLQGVAAAL